MTVVVQLILPLCHSFYINLIKVKYYDKKKIKIGMFQLGLVPLIVAMLNLHEKKIIVKK